MPKSLVVFYGNDPQYLAIVWQLVRHSQAAGDTPVLFDLNPVLDRLGDTMNRRALGLFGVPSPDTKFVTFARDEKVDVLDAADFTAAGREFTPSAQALEGIRETTRSALISFSRDPAPDTRHRPWRSFERGLYAAALRIYSSVCAVLAQDPDFATVLVHNGRFPQQRAAIEAALAQNRSIMHYEKGEKPNTYWFSPFSTLDRSATQRSVDDVLSHLGREEARDLGRSWMNRRSARGSANIYSRFFADDAGQNREAGTKVVGLFTSSQDEFAALGPEWHVQEWTDQLLAFEHVLEHLEPFGFSFFLRVHPNFATKSHASFLRERSEIQSLALRHPDLRVIWHDEKVNSYSLIDDTDVVVVWDSTIGLEASGRGKPVWELAASYYDLYADVNPWFSPGDAPAREAVEYAPNVEKAERFMAYLDIREPLLSDESIGLARRLAPRQGVALRLSNLLSSGGSPLPRIALSATVDAMRHRRASINVRAARSFLR